MVLTHGIVCSSNPQSPRGGRRCGGKMLWFVKTQTTEEDATFILYNSIGEKILIDNLNKQNKIQRIDLNNIANGI